MSDLAKETAPGPAPMEGDGGYNRRSAVQASAALPILERAAGLCALPDGEASVVVADYGASEGRNSLAPIGLALDALRARVGPERPVSVVHTDLPDNDFSSLFRLLSDDPASYMRRDPAVFASAVGRSFYERLLPPGSVSLGWSAWAVQWLSRVPALIPDHVQIAYSSDEPARAAFALQAARDWETFLACRATELLPGGQLVILTMARTDEGDFGYDALLAALKDTLRSLVNEGLVRADDARRMAIPTVGRSRVEFAAPFANGSFAGLTLDWLDIVTGEDAIWHDFMRDRDAHSYGRRWAAFAAASVLPTLAGSLTEDAGGARAARFKSRMEEGMSARLAASPCPMVIPLAVLLLSRGSR